MNDRDSAGIIRDISLLYELSLSIGRSLDLKEDCDIFLRTLMARKNLAFSSVWIKNEYLIDKEDKRMASLVYANPAFRIREETLPLGHPLFNRLKDKEFFSLAAFDDGFSEIITERLIEKKGSFAIFALKEIGVLKLFCVTRSTPFKEKELNQLRNVVSNFTISLEGCLFHQRAIREIAMRKQVEEELRRYHDHLEELVREQTAELKKANEQLLRVQKLESIGILAGGIAHDFNNILATILLNTQYAKMMMEREEDIAKYLDGTERATQRAVVLTHQLLTFARGGAPIKKTIHLPEFIKETVEFALSGSNLRCEFSIPDDLWLVEADEGQLNQVINNLIINADQAQPSGGMITVSAENMTHRRDSPLPLKEGDYVRISIKDRGIGIPEENLPKIFDPYFTTKQKGSGLGLSTAYSILQRHGGYIDVESKVGHGTTFYIYLPASSRKVRTKKRVDKILKGEGRILLMDDEEGILGVVSEALAYLGYEVELARDGEMAVRLYKEAKESGRPFRLVIMDLTIPGGMGGREAIGKLIEIDPQVKAIVSSGYSNDPVMANFRRYGFSEVLLKPFRIEDIRKTLNKIIK